MSGRHKQRGVILISALIIVATATVIAAALFFDTGLTARRAAANQGLEQAFEIARGAESLAAQVLDDDTGQTDTPQDSWAPEMVAEVEDHLRFSVWTGLAAHQPLGNINRARKSTYENSANFRAHFNGCPIHEPQARAASIA